MDKFKLKTAKAFIIHALTILLAAHVIFYGIDASIARSDESIHATVAREIAFGSSPWWRPTFFNALYLNKPPLQLWGTAGLLHLLGDHNFVYRIIPAIAGIGSLSIIYFWVKVSFGGYFAALSAVLFALSGNHLLFDHGIRVATQDSTLLFLTLLASFLFFNFLFSKNSEKPIHLYLGALAVGAACLTKWIAGALPLIIFGVFLIVTKDGREIFKRNFRELIVAIFIAAIIPGVFLLPHLLYEFDASIAALTWNLSERLIGKGFHNQDEFYHYFEHLFWKGSYGEPLAVLGALLYGLFNFKDPKIKFLLLWLFIPLFGFSALSSRLAWYFLPAAGSVWILFGALIGSLDVKQYKSSLIKLIFVGLILVVAFGLSQQTKRLLSRGTIPLDAFAEDLRGKEYTVDFSKIDLSKDGAFGLTRRQIFYLNRLRANSISNGAQIISLIPYDEFKLDFKLQQNKHICLASENKKTKQLACLVVN